MRSAIRRQGVLCMHTSNTFGAVSAIQQHHPRLFFFFFFCPRQALLRDSQCACLPPDAAWQSQAGAGSQLADIGSN